jgi:hypothetical protein
MASKNGKDGKEITTSKKGNSIPINGTNGPECPSGEEIDNQFDIFDPINSEYSCVSSLKTPELDKMAEMAEMANNASGAVADLAGIPVGIAGVSMKGLAVSNTAPAAGGRGRSRRRSNMRKRKTRTKRRSHHTRYVRRHKIKTHRSRSH